MTRKMFWSTLGALVFVLMVIANLVADVPEAVVIAAIAFWSACFAFTLASTNGPRKEHWEELEKAGKSKTKAIRLATGEVLFAPEWMDKQTCLAFKDEDWHWLERVGGVKIGPSPVDGISEHLKDLGSPFPWVDAAPNPNWSRPHMDVQEARENIDRAGRQKFCKHLDKTDITELGDLHKKFYCLICDKIIES